MVASAVTDFPEPDSPTMPSTSPGSSVKSTPRTAWTTPSLVGKSTSRRSICRAGSAIRPRTRLFLGSKASRRPSPIRKMDRIRTMRKATGKTKSHHSVVAESWPWSTSRPNETAGGWTPSPRKDSVDSKDDAQGDRQRGVDDDGADGVGQHVLDDDAPVGRAERPGRLDEVTLAQRQEVRPHEPGDVGPRQDADDEGQPEPVVRLLGELGRQEDQHGQHREDEDQVDEAHEQAVDPAAVEAGDGADRHADQRGHGGHRQRDLDVLLDARHDLGEHVVPDGIGAERVGPRRRVVQVVGDVV